MQKTIYLGLEVECFKPAGHDTTHEGAVYRAGDYEGTHTWNV
jgi:hypothetical protein